MALNFSRGVGLAAAASVTPLAMPLGTLALAQGIQTEFPADAVPLTADLFRANVLGKTFAGKRADGVGWTMTFNSDASFRSSSVQEGGGAPRTDSGTARMEGDKLCQDMRKAIESGCNEVRWRDSTLFYKRNSNGEVLTLKAR